MRVGMGTPSCSEGRAKGGRWMGMGMGTRTREEEGGSRGQTERGRQQTTTTTKGKGTMGWDGRDSDLTVWDPSQSHPEPPRAG